MSIENIKSRLDSLGYHTWVSAYLNVARKVSDEDPRIIESEDYFCAIKMDGELCLISGMRSQIPDWAAFGSESEVVGYIKRQFPL